MPTISAMMQSTASSSQSQTQTVAPGQPIPETEPDIVRTGNVHGFSHSRSRNRASSCPARTATDRNPPAYPPSPSPNHPQHRNREPRPVQQQPVRSCPQFYIGEEEDKREEEVEDPWARAREQNRSRVEEERAQQAVHSNAWSGYTGTTRSVQQAQPCIQQAPFIPHHSYAAPSNFVIQDTRNFQKPSSALHPLNYGGTHWEQQGSAWRPEVGNMFGQTFQQNAFAHSQPYAFSDHPAQFQEFMHAQPQPSQTPQAFLPHAPPFPASNSLPLFPNLGNPQFTPIEFQPAVTNCPQCAQFHSRCVQLERTQSTEFQPAGEYTSNFQQSQLPIQAQLQARNDPFQNCAGQSSGVWVDRGSSSEFRPPENVHQPVHNHHANGPAFSHGMQAVTTSDLFSPIANPRPPMSGAFMPHVISPPSIPSIGHFGLSQVSVGDFMPTMQEDWEARSGQIGRPSGQSNSFFGHENADAFRQQFDALHSAAAPFNYAHIGAGTFGDRTESNMFGKGGWGEDIHEEEQPEYDINHPAFRPPEPAVQSFHSTASQRPAYLPPIPERDLPYDPQRRPVSLPQVCQCMTQKAHYARFGSQHDSPSFGQSTPAYQHQGYPPPPPPPPNYPGGDGYPRSSQCVRQDQYGCFSAGNPGPNDFGLGVHVPGMPHQNPPGGGGPFMPGGGAPPPPGGGGGFFPQQMPPPARPPQKRWLPPPSFTPGSAQGPSFKSWLWQLAAWCRLTGMSWDERALAVALSLGGRARSLVYTIPHNILHQRNGLAVLLQRLESDFGTELQDRAKSASQSFENFRRGKGMSASEYIAAFEQAYQNAVDHGVTLSIPLLSMRLVERASLNPSQEEWILGAVGGDWAQYQGIRRALRRLPSLGGQGAGVFPTFNQTDQAEYQAYPAVENHDDQYQPFSNGASDQLHIPPQAKEDDEYSCTQYSDDYCSTGSGDEEENMHVQQAWAQLRRFKKRSHSKSSSSSSSKGKGKGKGKRGRFKKRKTGTFILIDDQSFPVNQRNLSSEIPQGWTPEKWLARSPCPTCGSRFHRDCANSSGSSGHKGASHKGKGGGKKGSGFVTFMVTAASMLNSAQSFLLHEPSYTCPAVAAHHFPAFVSEHYDEYQTFLATIDSSETYIGMEPFGDEYRTLRFATFSSLTKSRYGLMLDTGAPESCCGQNFLDRFLHDMDIKNAKWSSYSASLSGIGAGSASVNWKCKTPIGIASFCNSVWETQVLEGCGKNVPGLMGLQPMTRLNGVINLSDRTFIVDDPNGIRKALQCYVVTGHLILPIDWGGKDYKGTKQDFIKDPLGMSLWYTSEEGQPIINPMPTFKLDTNSDSSVNTPLPCFPCLIQCTEQTATQLHSDVHTLNRPLPCFPCLQHKESPVETPPGLHSPPLPSEGENRSRPEKFDVFTQPDPASSNDNAEAYNAETHRQQQLADANFMHPAFVGFVNRTHAWMSKLARRDLLMQNSTYRKKYAPLPKDTPIPNIKVAEGKWDFWEWWAGSARLTKACIKKGLVCGPPVTRELGWDLTLETHQRHLRLLFDKHTPEVLFAAPTCGPWSRSNTTMNDTTKQHIREEQVEAFSFYLEHAKKQTEKKRKHLMENPRSSELLLDDTCYQLIERHDAIDNVLCMCAHGLKDQDNGLPNMKQTTLRGNLVLRRSIRWCSCTVPHQHLQGHNKSGALRTAAASPYTRLFCERLAADIQDNIKGKASAHTSAFPAEEDDYRPNPSFRPRDPTLNANSDEEQEITVEPAVDDPYFEPSPEETKREADKLEQQVKRTRASRPLPPPPPAFVEPTGKVLPRPKAPTHIDEETRLARALAPAEPLEPSIVDEIKEIDDLLTDPKSEPLPIAVRKPVLDSPALNDIAKVGTQLPNGAQRTFQTGPKLKLLQEMYGTPVGRTIRLVILTRKPGMIPIPEPLVSRALLSHFLQLTQDTIGANWNNHGWRLISELTTSPRTLNRKPQWSIVLFAIESTGGDLAEHLQSSTLETLEERAAIDSSNSSSLPAVLKILTEGDQQAQLRMLLTLHKRLYHKKSQELKAILNRSGVPGRVLGMLDDAIAMCAECRRWQSTHASPAIKTRISDQFNRLVYADLIFISDPPLVMLVMLDDSIRWCVVENVIFKDFSTLTEHFRKAWLKQYGPMETLRSDKESALASDQFGILLESLGIKRELVLAKDSHTMLGPIDRKIKIIRLAAPRIIDTLLQDSIRLSGDDLASELQFSLNTQLTYGGVSPYNCLFGTQPREFWTDESENTSSHDVTLPFYEMVHIRHKAIGAFHQALLRFRLEKGVKARPRSDQAENYQVGQLVDVFIKNTRKDQESWRGPATILGFLGEGRCTVRWQSTVRDVPYNLIRPFISVIQPSLPMTAVQDKLPIRSEDPASSIADAPPPFVVKRKATVVPPNQPAHVPTEGGSSSSTSNVHLALIEGRNSFECFFNISSADQLRGPYFDTLVSLTSTLQVGQQQLHAYDINGPSNTWSRDATRDDYVIFNVARKFASLNDIPHYVGAILQSGRRYVSPWEGGRKFHGIAWTDSQFVRLVTLPASGQIDWINEGICSMENLHLLRSIVIIEARKEPPTLDKLLQTSQDKEVKTEPAEGRVREQWYDDELLRPPAAEDKEDSITDPGPSISERDEQETFLTHVHIDSITLRDPHKLKSTTDDDSTYFPLDKDCRPMSEQELIALAPEVRTAKLKELTAWVKNKAGKPTRKEEYTARTGLKPLPTRWVETFKRKKGVRIVKERLVGKGFAEANQATLETSSPTATRTSHRIVMSTAARKKWNIHSLDVSAAFLKGFDFAKLKELGFDRQPVALVVSAEIFQLLAELDDEWKEASQSPDDFCIELSCGAYGLKDAPLLWHIRFVNALTTHGLRQSSHDACLFYLPLSDQELKHQADEIILSGTAASLLISLHVDDTLATGEPSKLSWILKTLVDEFEDVTVEVNHFRHFGVDVYRCPKEFHIYADQGDYVKELNPMTMPVRSRREDPCSSELITAFRSLVSGIAWVGVTYAPALAAASLYQSHLPQPTHADCHNLNFVLTQLKAEYTPLIFRAGLRGPFRIVEIADSSLGNASKYSQGGYYVLLASRNEELLCGNCHQLSFKSSKSKRVASSTEHAEMLATTAGVEEALFLQTWLHELQHPELSARELLKISGKNLIPIVAITDCMDLLESLTKTAVPTPTNRALTLYMHSLRELRTLGYIEAFVWVDTRDNLANALTKLRPDGGLDLTGLDDFYKAAGWEPKHPFGWHSRHLSEAGEYTIRHLPPPPPPTKIMADKRVKEVEKEEMLPTLKYHFVSVVIILPS